jgi:hypothetical protein
MLANTAILVTALLFGGMVLYSFGFAAFIFSSLPAELAGPTIRKAFPHFYVFVMATSLLAALLLWPIDPTSAILMAVILVTTLPTRQFLMPAINRATDAGQKLRFKWLHTISVLITLTHMALAAIVLTRFV